MVVRFIYLYDLLSSQRLDSMIQSIRRYQDRHNGNLFEIADLLLAQLNVLIYGSGCVLTYFVAKPFHQLVITSIH
jgi:hypothetical protein